jgi:hypothetical protein
MTNDANFACLCCGGTYTKGHHYCIEECHVDGTEVYHYDFCQKCIELLLNSFRRQFQKRLHVEE